MLSGIFFFICFQLFLCSILLSVGNSFQIQLVPHFVLFCSQVAGVVFVGLYDDGDNFLNADAMSGQSYFFCGVVGDKPDGGGAVDYETFKEDAAKHCASIVRYMVENL